MKCSIVRRLIRLSYWFQEPHTLVLVHTPDGATARTPRPTQMYRRCIRSTLGGCQLQPERTHHRQRPKSPGVDTAVFPSRRNRVPIVAPPYRKTRHEAEAEKIIHRFCNALCLGATESEHFGDSHQIGQ